MMNANFKIPSLLHWGCQSGRAILTGDLGIGEEKKILSI
jgi:hypothetical protein